MTLKKDIKYIIKRIIIGVGIVLLLYLLRSSTGLGLILDVEAQEVNATPQDIILNQPNSSPVTFSVTTNTWNNQTVYAIPGNISYDWSSGSSLYFRYPQNAGATYCNWANNKATLSFRLYNASTGSIGGQMVRFEDTTSSSTKTCDVTSYANTNYLDVICNNIDSNHGFNIMLQNAYQGRWGVVRQLQFDCIQSGENITENINANNNQNTQNIINNNNENTNKILDQNITCNTYYYSKSAAFGHSYITTSGNLYDSTFMGATNYIPLGENDKIVAVSTGSYNVNTCFYDSNRTKISCISQSTMTSNQVLSIPSGAEYVRFSLQNNDKTVFKICKPSQQFLTDALTDNDISTASRDFDQYFNELNPNTHGLSDIVTAPLRLVQSLTSSSCSPLVIPLPFVNQNVTLPCMVPIYQTYFGQWFTLYQLITTGVIAYWVGINFFRIFKGLFDPTNDKVEVFDL